MTDQIRPSNSAEDAAGDPVAPADPTELLSTPQGASPSCDEPEPQAEAPAPEEAPAQPQLRTQSKFTRERAKDQQAALDSLDETVLRPPVTPISFEEAPPAPPQTPAPVRRRRWRLAAAAIVATALATAVTAKALSSRQSNVGLLGVQTVSDTLSSQIDGPVSHDGGEAEQPVDEPAATEAQPQEETAYPEEQPTEEEPSYPDWVYVSPRYDRDSTGEDTSSEGDGSTTGDQDSYGLRMDDESISYRYDGGEVSYDYDTRDITYDYGGGSVTFDSDALDEIERYLEQNDSWDYYDWGYSYSDGGDRGRGRTHDYGPGHGYIGGW